MASKRILIVGAGSIGERHLLAFRRLFPGGVGICEINVERRLKASRNHNIEQSFGSLQDALTLPWDAAVVATPADSHLSIGLELALAGIPLLIEKPLGVTEEGATEFVEQVRSRKLPVAVGYLFRTHPALLALRRAIGSGRFGKPLQIVVLRGAHVPTRRPQYREIYAADRARGGGAIQDVMTHLYDSGQWLVGPITELGADAAHLYLQGVEVEDTVHVTARHGDILGCYCLNQHQRPYEFSITVSCRQGTARAEFHRNRWCWMTEPDGQWQEETFPAQDLDSLLLNQAEAFVEILKGGRGSLCTVEEGLQNLRVALATLASVDGGGTRLRVRVNMCC